MSLSHLVFGAGCEIYLSAKRGPASTIFNDFGMSRPGIEPVTSRSPERTLYQLSYRGRWFKMSRFDLPAVEIGHEIISTAILSLLLIQVGQLSVTGERMCTSLSQPRKGMAWLTDCLDMTIVFNHKTNKHFGQI